MDYYLGKLNAITRGPYKGKQKHQSQRRRCEEGGDKEDRPRITKALQKAGRHQEMDSLRKGMLSADSFLNIRL